ncbi:hypothetical protein L1987_26275 [Smallanthus sonchifolius]|uniref:Uncharacterized protein n=1 Tax=Smallanthus sonchifolius TaxID=185202 RepID=A0ACB9I9C3_9ASTR|nr:hypothetical protein L1987_26275 [Smallanthus sonchifolius]
MGCVSATGFNTVVETIVTCDNNVTDHLKVDCGSVVRLYGWWLSPTTTALSVVLLLLKHRTAVVGFSFRKGTRNVRSEEVGITIIESAVAKGAVCLDGSPPAYQLDKGFGDGVNNWLVHIQGGGWCHTIDDCVYRKTMDNGLGSSKLMPELYFSGILSNRQDFYNWNRVYIRYCDGSSFTGDVEEVDPANNLYFRGARVFNAIVEKLTSLGMKNVQNVI